MCENLFIFYFTILLQLISYPYFRLSTEPLIFVSASSILYADTMLLCPALFE